MRRLALVLLPGVLILAGSGCGTACNFFNGESKGPVHVYGGVQADCQAVAEQFRDHPGQGTPFPEVLCALLDLPLSLLGDTLTLPLVLSDRLHDLTADRPPAPPPGPAPDAAPR